MFRRLEGLAERLTSSDTVVTNTRRALDTGAPPTDIEIGICYSMIRFSIERENNLRNPLVPRGMIHSIVPDAATTLQMDVLRPLL